MTPTGDLSRCWKVVSMETDGSASHLNPSQALHLLTSARYADKLFADIESVLFASKSKSPFREYKNSFPPRSEEHTSVLQSRPHLVCRLLLEKKKKILVVPIDYKQNKLNNI